MSLAAALSTVALTETANVPVPKGFDAPGIDYANNTGTLRTSKAITSEEYKAVFEKDTGLPVPEGLDVVLERATVQRIGAAPGNIMQYWYKFKFVPRVEAFSEDRHSIKSAIAWVKEARRKPVDASEIEAPKTAAVLSIADLQIGKTDRWGGTKETQEAFYAGVELMKDYIKRNKPDMICLAELGDGAENFQNTPSQAQTNDLQLIEQLDLHTELLTYAAVELSKLTKNMVVAGVPSNHMEVRENGKAVGGPHNDYGLLSLSNVRRIMAHNPKAFGHVQFAWPEDHEVSMTLDLAGYPVGFAHGHYARGNADGIEKWLTGQFAGNHPLQPAKIVNTGHFHHLRIQNIIGGRWWIGHPTLDRGSSWLERATGVGNSQNGIVAYTVQSSGWSNFELLKTN